MFLDVDRVAEGWYPDPSGRLLLRYWDGNAWGTETRGNDSWVAPVSRDVQNPVGRAPETGWAGIAFSLYSALMSGTAASVGISLPTGDTFTVNTHNHVYTWANEPALLPEFNGAAAVTFAPGLTDEDGRDELPPRSLDGLLWRISAAAFTHRLAPWLQEDDLYRMQRWPNLTTINPELDDMRQAAMLANGMFTVDELAGFSDRSIPETRTLINALSLMNTLKVATPRTTTTFVPAPGSFGVAQPKMVEQQTAAPLPNRKLSQAPAKPGLFQRLRTRLGL